MLLNYLRGAFRIFGKYKLHSAINVIGLSTGMALCLIMLMVVANEFSYDSFYENEERIYRITSEWGSEGSTMKFAGTLPAVAPALNAEVPEVESAARIKRLMDIKLITEDNKEFIEELFFYADPEILKILPGNLESGNSNSLLNEPYSIVLTHSTAEKIFPDISPIGQILVIGNESYKITGVLSDLNENTHFQYNGLISYSTYISKGSYPQNPWSSFGSNLTYVLLAKDKLVNECSLKLREIFERNSSASFSDKMILRFQPLGDIHWNNSMFADLGPKGNLLYTYLFLAAAIVILIIACFNFMNLSTAKYTDRAKEIGVRKVIGASRIELIKQFLAESVLTSLIAAIIGVVLYELLSGVIYSYIDITFNLHSTQLFYFYSIIISMLLIVGLIAGFYPAMLFSKFEPVTIMRGNSVTGKKKLSFRNFSVMLQFVISVILFCSAIIIFQQIDYMRNTDLGFEKKNVVFSYLPRHLENAADKYEVLKNELMKNPDISYVSGAYTIPGVKSQWQMSVRRKDASENDNVTIQTILGDYDFLKLMNVKLKAGRDFNKEYLTDPEESVLLNEAAVAVLNLDNPVGESIVIPGDEEQKVMKIIGVVEDFHFKSLHSKIAPAMIIISLKDFSLAVVKYLPGTNKNVVNNIKTKWAAVFPGSEFDYRFMEDEYNKIYNTEERAGKLIMVFTVLAFFISCLGLFGLVSFIASKKVKEVGIRKVLGASIQNIAMVLSKQFIIGVVAANVIAWPAAYYLMNIWLQNFAYKIDIGIWVFVISGIVTLAVALATVGFYVIKAALANPVDSLRYE